MATGRIPTTANSPLTAKGDLFTFSTGSAKLAVGNNGETLVADSSTATGLAYREDYAAGKNKIINGDFRFNQRNFTSITSGYGFDRFQLGSGDANATYTPQAFTPGTAPVTGYEAINFARVVTTNQTTSGQLVFFNQNIEDVRTFANQTATVSFWAKAASGTPKIAIEISQQFGSGGSPSSDVFTYAGQVTLSTSWARYSVTVNVPSISGKTIGTTQNTSSLALNLWYSAGSTFNSRTGSLGLQNNTFDIWGVQVEDGSVATAFNTATGTLQGELAACQRYYYQSDLTGSAYGRIGIGRADSTTAIEAPIPLPVPMRVKPTSVTINSLTTTAANTITAVALAQPTTTVGSVQFTSSSLTTGQAVVIIGNNSVSAYIAFSAEL